MYYGRFRNFGEILFGDACGKLLQNWEDENWSDLSCNCKGGVCKLGSACGVVGGIYFMTCQICEDELTYIGSSSRNCKERINKHLYDVRTTLRTGKKFDTFSEHMVRHYNDISMAGMSILRNDTRVGILRNLRRISKSGTASCELCTAERFELLKGMFSGGIYMNLREEIYTKCRHPTKFSKWVYKGDVFTDDPE